MLRFPDLSRLMLSLSLLCWVGGLTASLQAQTPSPAPAQSQPIILQGGTIHTATGEVIDNGFIRFDKGIITAMGPASDMGETAGAKLIQTAGHHLYPGLILPNNTIGLREIDAVTATLDYDETGDVNPNLRALIAFNTDSRIIPTVRSNGVLLAQTTPRGGLVSGQSAIVQLDAWNWEDAAYQADDGIHLNWPSRFQWRGGRNKRQAEFVRALDQVFAEARAYAQINQPEAKNLRFEAMKGLYDGSKTLFIAADWALEIVQAIQFAEKHGVQKIVIKGGTEAHQVADFLVDHKVPVILQRVFDLPHRADEDIDLPYKLPFLLKQAGVLFCLSYRGDMEAAGSRNLPFAAGFAVAHGLTKEEALMTVTKNTAEILGIADRTGTLEVGKEANIVISKGDLLDMRTNDVVYAFIMGRQIDLDDPHKGLYRKYKEKYERDDN